MCGIMGYVGRRAAAPLVLAGLQQLEYRGYDSAGLAVMGSDGTLQVRRAEGKLVNLAGSIAEQPLEGSIGVGHTRWATHGPPVERNAHPHCSSDGMFAVVQNGIVENYAELRVRLSDLGYQFSSDTDTETIVHLLHYHYHNGCEAQLDKAVQATLAELRGPSAVVVVCRYQPDRLIAARVGNAGGVAVGLGDGEYILASDLPAVVQHARQVVYLESGEMAYLSPEGVVFGNLAGATYLKEAETIDWNPEAVDRGVYRHYMEKEIFEQTQSLTDTLRGRLDFAGGKVELGQMRLERARAARLERVVITACGTSYYAGLLGKHYIERLARLPVEVDYASEFRYREPVLSANTLVVAITQSGETADTLAAIEEAKAQGAFTAAIVNVTGSQTARLCDGIVPMQAGPEIGVASTKAFTASLTDLLMLAIYLGKLRGTLADDEETALISGLAALPGLAGGMLEQARRSGFYTQLAEEYTRYHNFLYIGRGVQYPIAREGALKLKEISYIHAEGYPAGEMKHGPIALIDPSMPTVALCPQDRVYDKMRSQIQQVKARNGRVLAVGHAQDATLREMVDALLPIPPAHEFVMPILAVMPLQLFAYEMALQRGADVDQPRNLAKSVTVE